MKRTEADLACIYLSLQAIVRLLIQASLAGDSPTHTVLHTIQWCLLLLRLSISTIAQALWRQCTDLGFRKFFKRVLGFKFFKRVFLWLETKQPVFCPISLSEVIWCLWFQSSCYFFSHLIPRFTKSHRVTDKWGPPSPRGGRSPDNRDCSTGTVLSRERAQIHLCVGVDMAMVRSECKLWQIATTTTGRQKEQWWRCVLIRKENECWKQNNQNPCMNKVINGQVIAEKRFLLY